MESHATAIKFGFEQRTNQTEKAILAELMAQLCLFDENIPMAKLILMADVYKEIVEEQSKE